MSETDGRAWHEGTRLVLVAGCVLAFAPAVHAATYKWVDDKGVVHYTDKIPPEAVNRATSSSTSRAFRSRRPSPRSPASSSRRRRRKTSARSSSRRSARSIDRRDRALLSTYTMESEIDLARRRALSTIEQQMQSSTAYSLQLNKRKGELDGKKGALGDKPVPPVLERELANINVELAKQNDLVAAKQKEVVLVNARYDADKKRWRELRAATEAQMNATARAQAAGAQGAAAQPTAAQK